MRRHALPIAALLVMVVSGCGGQEPQTDVLTPPPIGDASATPGAASDPPAATTPPRGSRTDAGELDRVVTDSDVFRERRDALVEQIGVVVEDDRVLDAMRAVPRHAFVPSDQVDDAYIDFPLPIGYGQTISQPSLVGQMTELLELEPGERVLEIGTGSGYQAAILGELTDEVYSVEIVPQLAGTARQVLDALGYGEIAVERRDGYLGWPEHAPYDAIVVTAAPDHLPQPLVEQLKEDGGRMVIPIGPVGDVQTLWLVTRENGEPQMERLLDVMFVPLVRGDE